MCTSVECSVETLCPGSGGRDYECESPGQMTVRGSRQEEEEEINGIIRSTLNNQNKPRIGMQVRELKTMIPVHVTIISGHPRSSPLHIHSHCPCHHNPHCLPLRLLICVPVGRTVCCLRVM